MKEIKERANAKINLYLDVLSKREDGFHDIKTVMHSVKFGDEITVTSVPAQTTSVKLTVIGSKYLPTDNRNLAVKAAHLFLERAKLSCEVNIKLLKRIPIAAGLAGGSSDAAAVLRAMNKIHSRLFSISALSELAAELGSDVAYCLYGKTALCEGRGEKITRLPLKINQAFVIAIANEYVSTPAAYKALDELYSDFNGEKKTNGEAHYNLLISSLDDGKIEADGLFNVFEGAVLPTCEGARSIKAKLLELGAVGAMMSGSGPSVFGVFDDIEAAKAACFVLRDLNYKAYYAYSI
jgi:4-diphosphocytidyl-2-C-methyl-D-erythritol kinase